MSDQSIIIELQLQSSSEDTKVSELLRNNMGQALHKKI